MSGPAVRYVLAVDLGTGGPKVGLVSTPRRDRLVGAPAVSTRRGPGGAATQDADEWWRLVVDSTRRGLAASRDRRATGSSRSRVTGQWASTVPVDEVGAPGRRRA